MEETTATVELARYCSRTCPWHRRRTLTVEKFRAVSSDTDARDCLRRCVSWGRLGIPDTFSTGSMANRSQAVGCLEGTTIPLTVRYPVVTPRESHPQNVPPRITQTICSCTAGKREAGLLSPCWWRRRESNPGPEAITSRGTTCVVHVYPPHDAHGRAPCRVVCVSFCSVTHTLTKQASCCMTPDFETTGRISSRRPSTAYAATANATLSLAFKVCLKDLRGFRHPRHAPVTIHAPVEADRPHNQYSTTVSCAIFHVNSADYFMRKEC